MLKGKMVNEETKEINYLYVNCNNQKIDEIKKYFSTDFSNMNEKTIKEINIWEDYLIYAILFNIRGKLDSEAYEIYEEYIEKFC